MYKTDYHIHTKFSDGRASAQENIDAAYEAGFNEMGFADHVLICKTNEKWCMDPKDLDEYYKYFNQLREESSKIPVKVGLEVDYIEGREKDIEKMLDKYDLDYRIGSVHYIEKKMCIDSEPKIYIGKDFDYVFDLYFKTVSKAVESNLFDIIGHFDLIRVFCFKPTYDVTPYYKDFSKLLKKHDITFEINTNGRNKPVNDFYPDKRFLEILANDGNTVCVNSDAHYPYRIGQFFDEAYELVKKAGFKEMATFNHRERKMVPIK